MSKRADQKLKILYIKALLEAESDVDHPVGTKRMLDYLEEHEIRAERKSLYNDIAALNSLGLDIVTQNGPGGGYYINKRLFETAEVKILADAVSSSKFLSYKQKSALLEKLSTLLPRFKRGELKRHIHVLGLGRHNSSEIFDMIDLLQSVLKQRKLLSFQYMEWVIENNNGRLIYEQRPRHRGERYMVLPLELLWDNENYYLVAAVDGEKEYRHFRIDRMQSLRTESGLLSSDLKEAALRFDPGIYSSRIFDMFNGEERSIALLFHKSLISAMIDRFGRDIIVQVSGMEDWYRTVQVVRVSERFYGWVAAFGAKLRLEGPTDIRRQYAEFLQHLLEEVSQDYRK